MKKLLAVLVLLASTAFASASDRPSVTVTGNGKVTYVPDLGTIQAGVSSDGSTATEAWQKNEEAVHRIFAALKQLGIEDKDVRTSQLNLQPRYLHRQNEEPKLLGYTASYDLTITVRKLPALGKVLDRLVDAGANRNMNLSFGCSNLDELLDQARTKAVADARKRANLYVMGAGNLLGEVLGITDTPYCQPIHPLALDALAVRESKSSLPIASGEQELTATVTITWAIGPQHRIERLHDGQ